MTVSSVYEPPQYVGNGTTTTFSFPYPFFAPGDLALTILNLANDLPVTPAPVLNGGNTYDFTVSGTQDVNTGEYLGGGVVTLNNALPGNYSLTITRSVSATQQVSLNQNGPFPSKTLEGALDRLTMIDQQTGSTLARAIVAPATDSSVVNLTLPGATARASQWLTFDASGNVTTSPPPSIVGVLASTITSPPAYGGSENSLANAFLGDFSKVPLKFSMNVSGAYTLGNGLLPYQYNPTVTGIYGYGVTTSGQNLSTTGNGNRTAFTMQRMVVQQLGQGDAVCYNGSVVIGSTLPNGTSWLDSPAGVLFNGDVFAAAPHVYCNPLEIDLWDEGYDCAHIGAVINISRSVNTAAQGDASIGVRVQSIGSKAIDAGLSLTGPSNIAIDLTTATLGTNQTGIAMAQGQRIVLAAVNTGGFPLGTNAPTTAPYLTSTATVASLVSSSVSLEVGPTGVILNGASFAAGTIQPVTGADGLYNLGGGTSLRWANIYLVNSPSVTSDPALKTDMTGLPESLPLIRALRPITYRMKEEPVEIDVEEDVDVPVTEQKTIEIEQVEMIAGVPTVVKKSQTIEVPVLEDVPVVDANGAPVMITIPAHPALHDKKGDVVRPATEAKQVQQFHQVQKTERRKVTVKKTVMRPGTATHWGFSAPQAAAAMQGAGISWGGYVKSDGGPDALRHDQFHAPMVKALQELDAIVTALKADVAALKAKVT